VFYGDRSVTLDKIQPDPNKSADTLWVRSADLPRINDFQIKPEGNLPGRHVHSGV